jgi:hypothetical protein
MQKLQNQYLCLILKYLLSAIIKTLRFGLHITAIKFILESVFWHPVVELYQNTRYSPSPPLIKDT